MDRDDVIRMAREAGLSPLLDNSLRDGDDVWLDCDVFGGLEKFADDIAANERQECEKACEFAKPWGNASDDWAATCLDVAIEKIRMRSDKKPT